MNESAFPWQIDNGETMRGHKGMTLRDYIATHAMQAILARTDSRFTTTLEFVGAKAYQYADAMMKAREA